MPWKKPPSKRRREIIVPQSATPQDTRPIRAETRATLDDVNLSADEFL